MRTERERNCGLDTSGLRVAWQRSEGCLGLRRGPGDRHRRSVALHHKSDTPVALPQGLGVLVLCWAAGLAAGEPWGSGAAGLPGGLRAVAAHFGPGAAPRLALDIWVARAQKVAPWAVVGRPLATKCHAGVLAIAVSGSSAPGVCRGSRCSASADAKLPVRGQLGPGGAADGPPRAAVGPAFDALAALRAVPECSSSCSVSGVSGRFWQGSPPAAGPHVRLGDGFTAFLAWGRLSVSLLCLAGHSAVSEEAPPRTVGPGAVRGEPASEGFECLRQGFARLMGVAHGRPDVAVPQGISGPEVLSKWVREGERHLRDVFHRAARMAPSVVLMDELDAIAGSRASDDARHLRELVSQLLVLLDGLEDRGRVLVIGTTNRPEDIDPAILRPGRIDRKVYLGPPNAKGRAALFAKLLARMPVAEDVRPEALAALTAGFTGAQIEHIVNEAGLLAVKEAIAGQLPTDGVRVSMRHFRHVIVGGVESLGLRRGRNG